MTCWLRSKRRRQRRWGTAGAWRVAGVLQQSEDGTATEKFEIAPRGFVEFGRRNLFGRNQSINLFARASLRSRASTTDVEPGEEPPGGYTFRDYRVLGYLSFAPRAGNEVRSVVDRVHRAGDPIELQLHATRRAASSWHAGCPRASASVAGMSSSATGSSKRDSTLRTRRLSIGCSRRSCCPRSPARSSAIHATIRSVRRRAR